MPHCRLTIYEYGNIAVHRRLLYYTAWMKRLAAVQTKEATIIAIWKASRTKIESDRPLRSLHGSQSASAHGPNGLQKVYDVDEL